MATRALVLVLLSWLALVAPVLAKPPCTEGLSVADLSRARTWKPRDDYRGVGSLASANAVLNQHLLKRDGLTTVPCEALEVSQVRDTLRQLFPLRDVALMAVYPAHDGRANLFTAAADMERQWAALPADDGRQRDAHCHEAVMWFVHHLPAAKQAQFAAGSLASPLPLLPTAQHATAGDDEVTKLYASKVTCQNCHVGGIESLGVPEVKPTTKQSIARRCYTDYKELFNLTCGPCDGISGIYTGDDDKYFTAPPCVVVSQPEDVPEAERVRPVVPTQFSVNVTGSDRFGRTTNPAGSNIIQKTYGQIKGVWHMNAEAGAKLWMLRHDTTYHELSIDGKAVPFFTTASVSEIHSQTLAQRTANVSGPMVSLVHGLPDWIPGGCTCIPDPVGVPDVSNSGGASGLAHMQYMGRIQLDPIEYLNRTVTLDHWANWFFHIFMDTDPKSPWYKKAPLRLASAYAGMSVYTNWEFSNPEGRIPGVWTNGIPVHPEKVGPDHGKFCLNPKKVDYCSNISKTTFPPRPEGDGGVAGAPALVAQQRPSFGTPMKAMLGAALAEAFEKPAAC